MKKIILITGSTDGIGKATAIESAKRGAKVIVHGKDLDKIQKTIEKIKKKSCNDDIQYILADLSDLEQVKKAFSDLNLPKLDILINNACVFKHNFKKTKDGFEYTFQICYLAHFIITKKLIPLLNKSDDARIINVSSMVHAHSLDLSFLKKESYDGYKAYEVSKLANVLFTYELAERLKGSNIKVNCLHPGVISTKLLHEGWGIGGADVSQGAKNLIYLAFSNDVKNITGKYFFDRKPTESSPITYDIKTRKQFWDYTEKLLTVTNNGIG